MPLKIVTWECETCGKNYGYDGYNEARSCELDHITDKAVAETRKAISEAFSGSKRKTGLA